MYFSMTFGDKNTWDDWRLVPTSLPVIAPPAKNTQIITVPSSNFVIDLSDSLTGYPTYGRRTGTIEYVALGIEEDIYAWEQLKSDMINYLYGQKMKVRYEEEPGWYYEGYVSLKTFVNDKMSPKVTISYDLDPYKWSEVEDIDTITLTDFSEVVNKTYRHNHFGEAPVTPTFVVEDTSENEEGIYVYIRNTDSPAIYKYPNAAFEHIFFDGTTVYEDGVIWGSTTEIAFSGEGTIKIITRRGKL